MIEVKAPAKLILFGEHFIVSSKSQAIITSVGLYTNCRITKNNDSQFRVSFRSDTFNIDVIFSKQEADEIYKQAIKELTSYKKTKNITTLKSLISQKGNFFRALVGYLTTIFDIKPSNIDLRCEAPLGSGMGTSASIASAMITGLLKSNGYSYDPASIYEMTKHIEDLQHGSSSGADPAAVIYGGLIHFEHTLKAEKIIKPIIGKSNWIDNVYLVFTGNPLESTGEMVSISNSFKDKNHKRYQEMMSISNEISQEFIKQNIPDMKKLINRNGILLEELDVVSPSVVEFSKKIRRSGGAVKIAGAGGSKGEGSGICIVWMPKEKTPYQIIEEFNFKLLRAPLMVSGINI